MFQKGLIFRLWWHSFCWQTLWGYERDMCRTIFTWIFIILSIGVLRLIFYWKPNWFIKFTHRRVNLSKATHVLLKVGYNGYRLNVMLLICRRQNFVHWYADTQGQIILEFDTHILMQIYLRPMLLRWWQYWYILFSLFVCLFVCDYFNLSIKIHLKCIN